MPVISAYSTSGSSYISPSSYRYRSSLSDRKSYTTSSSSFYHRKSSYRYDLPSSTSSYSSYRSTADRTADAELSASLSTLATSSSSSAKDPTTDTSSTQAATTTVNNKDTSSSSSTLNRPSRYSTAYSSYSSYSSAPSRDYSSRLSSRSSDTRFKDRDNNCLCTGGSGSTSSYVSNLRNTALSGADLYQKYSVSTYKPTSFERIISRSPSETPKPSSILTASSLKASSPSKTALDISKVNNIPAKDRNSNFDAVVVANHNNNPTNTNGTISVANTPLETNCKLTAANSTGAKPASAACFLNTRSENSTCCNSITATTITTTTTTITTTTSSTSVLLSSSSSSSVLYDTTTSFDAARGRKPSAVPTFKSQRAESSYPLSKLRPHKPPLPKSAFTSSSNDLSITGGRKELLGLSSYRNQNFLKNECDLVKRELSKSATEIAFKKGPNHTSIRPILLGSTTNLRDTAGVDDFKERQPSSSSYLSKLEAPKVKQFLPPVPSCSSHLLGSSKSGQPKDHEDDDKKHHHHHAHQHHSNQSSAGISQPQPSAVQPQISTTSGVELKPIDRPTILECTQKNDTSLFKSSSPSSTTTTTPKTTTTESLTTASSSSSTCTTTRTYTTNSRSAETMKSLYITSELEESITQATIKLRPSLNGTGNGSSSNGSASKVVATASATTDDINNDGDYHVTATIRIKPKSSISHHSTSSSSSSSTNGSTTSINNNNNANDGGGSGSSSGSDDHDIPNGNSRNGTQNNHYNNNNNNGNDEDDDDDDDDDDDNEDSAAVRVNNGVDKEPKSNDDDKVSYLRAGTASKSIHSTSPVGYRSRDYDSGISSSSLSNYRSGLNSTSSSSSSSALQKSSYDRTNEDSSDSYRGGSRKEGLCGLYNIGNTCFMNSVIQCLSHTRELTNYLRNQPTTERGPSKDHKILAEYTKLIKDMWNGTNKSVNPSELKYAFSSKHRMYSGSAQQDAQEFLRFFIDSLHSALNISVKREPISREIEDDDMNNRVKADMMWTWYSKVENSMIKDLFVGLLRSTLTCTYCNNSSVTFDPFWDLSLPLPSTNSRCKLENCFDMFMKEEVMDGIDQPTCSYCKARRKCTKSLTIERFPKYLVIHLKRFSETRWSKLTNVIEFATGERELNLQSYASEDNMGPVYFSLYGISNHMGSTAGGHYIAACKHPISKDWNEFNDNFVSETSERSLVTSSAYVLFYERA